MLEAVWWLPESVSVSVATILITTAGITSCLTAALGAGGGVILLAVMAQVMSPLAIIPVHGVVQLGSNFNRALMMWRFIDWRIIAAFFPGMLLGAWFASEVLIQLEPMWLQLSIAGFILFLCWGPKLPQHSFGKVGTFTAAGVTTFIGMFVGASGPLVASFIKQIHTERFKTVATFAVAMSLQHIPKIFVFGALGFTFQDWLPLMAGMIMAGVAGTWVGLQLLKRFSNHHFDRLFSIILTALAIRLIWQALA